MISFNCLRLCFHIFVLCVRKYWLLWWLQIDKTLSKIWAGSEHRVFFPLQCWCLCGKPLPKMQKIPTPNLLEIKFCLRHCRPGIGIKKKRWPIFGHFGFMETLNSTRRKWLLRQCDQNGWTSLSGCQQNPLRSNSRFSSHKRESHFMRKFIFKPFCKTIIMNLYASLYPILMQQIQLDTMNVRSITWNTVYNCYFIASRK